MSLLLAIPLVLFLTSRAAFSEPTADVLHTFLFGPAPAGLMSTQGRYMWAISEVQNTSASAMQAEVSLTVEGAPEGCDQMAQLILPAEPSFELAAGERNWVLYRVRYECHSPADASVYSLPVELCAGEQGQAPTDCSTSTRQLITQWDGTYLGVDVDGGADPSNLPEDLGSLDACGPVSTGDRFDVDLYVTEVEDLFGWYVQLGYDPAVVKVVDIDVWQLQGQNAGSLATFYGDQLPDADGTFAAMGVDLGPVSAGDSGTGVLGRITVEAVGPGVSPLTISQPDIVNEAGVHIGDTNGDGWFDGPVINAQVAVDQDPDGDGLATPCGDPAPDNPDADGDGMSDLAEAEVGSDPLDPSDAPVLDTTCPAGSQPVYDEDGNFTGCYSSEEIVKLCDAAGADFDGDGYQDSCDPDPVVADSDGDAVPDPFEAYVGRDPRDACSADPLAPAWPFDMNADTWANDDDIQLFHSSGAHGTQHGDDGYNPRYDLNADGAVSDLDIQLYADAGVLGTQCSEGEGQEGRGLAAALAERQAVLRGGSPAAPSAWIWPPFGIYYSRVSDNARFRVCLRWWWFGWHQKCGTGYSLMVTQGWYYTSGGYIFAYDRPLVNATAKGIYCYTSDAYSVERPAWVRRSPTQAMRTDAYLSWTASPMCWCDPHIPFEMGGCLLYAVSSNKLTFWGDGSCTASHWGFSDDGERTCR